ncbi:MAG: anti-sigma factor domain-containing protein [Nitrososphaerales archaeon]
MIERNHEWFVELIPAYAIGAADPEERAAVDAHLRACAECHALLEEYRDLDADLVFAAPLAAAPARLTENLRKQLKAAQARPRRRLSFEFLRSPALALTVAALALLVLTNVYWASRVGRLERQASELAALSQAPGITLKASGSSGRDYDAQNANGVVYVQPGSNVALLCVYALPQPGPGKTYQAWLVRDGQRESAGTFGVNDAGYGVLLINAGKPVSDFQQLGITVEPAGGSLAPTTPRVMGGEL